MASCGMERWGMVWLARRGMVWLARYGLVWLGEAGHGRVWQGLEGVENARKEWHL